VRWVNAALLCWIFAIPCSKAAAQTPVGGEISWTYIRTELERDALGFVAEVLPKLNQASYFANDNFAGYLGPSVEVRTGGDDAFDSFVARLHGFVLLPRPLDEEGEPNNFGWVHVIPFSLGLETDRSFRTPIMLAEAGWTPIGPRGKIDENHPERSQRFGLAPDRAFGLFFQAGYKFDFRDSSGVASDDLTDAGGLTNSSEEEPDHGIARVKGVIVYGISLADRVSILPRATGWYDIVNSEVYYRLEARIRVNIVLGKSALDFGYEKGSGVPNFNEGDQFSTGLTMAF